MSRLQAPSTEDLLLAPNLAVADAMLANQLARHREPTLAERIRSLPAWLEDLFGHSPFPPLASELQMLATWEKTLRDLDLPFDLHPPTLAPLALQGWRQVKGWRVERQRFELAEYGRDLRFGDWCRQFEQRLVDQGQISAEQLAEQLLSRPADRRYRRIQLAGFVDRPAPLWLALFAHLAEEVQFIDWQDKVGELKQFGCDTPEQELRSAAIWAKAVLAAHNPARVGIIAARGKADVGRLAHELVQLGVATNRRLPLSESGPIQGALALLQINGQQIGIGDARALVENPFWGDYAKELSLRTGWETRLCQLETRTLFRSDLAHCLAESKALVELVSGQQRAEAALAPSAWAELFNRQLHKLGWPGTQLPQEDHVLACESWLELLGDLASLNTSFAKLEWSQVYRWLKIAASQRTYLNTARSEGVWLLDRVEEAAEFNFLWLLGADDQDWPPPPKPHPLVPFSLQSAFDMPRHAAQRELELCQNLLASLNRRADQIICSFARSRENLSCKLTPLLGSLPQAQIAVPVATPTAGGPFEWIDCSSAPALAADQRQIRGGSRVLQLMTASPFDAFAELRLKANPLGQPSDGVSPKEFGKLLHDLLERSWLALQNNQQGLLALTDSERQRLAAELSRETLAHWRGAWRIGHNQRHLVADLLADTLLEWLQLESQRPPFEVHGTERDIPVQLGPITLQVRIDRIDRTDQGLLLIDYKSGTSGEVRDWLVSPPQQPQLPLYCIALNEPCAAIAIARLRLGQCKWVGLGATSLFSGIKGAADWGVVQANWRADLIGLAEGFAQGDTRVAEPRPGHFGSNPLARLQRFSEYEDMRQWLQTR